MRALRLASLPLLFLSIASSSCEDEVITRAEGSLEVDPERIDLGDVAIGLSAKLEIKLTAAGEATVTIKSAGPDAMLGGEFTLTGVPDALGPGRFAFVELAFAPTSPGVREGKLVFETDSTVRPKVEISVTARGVEPALAANPPILDFGRVVVGQTATATVTLTNRSDQTVELIRADLESGTSSEFVATAARQGIAPAGTAPLVVRYTPAAIGPDEGRIIIIESAPRAEALGIRVRGEGVASDIEIDPVRLDYGGITVGQRLTKIFYIRNIGVKRHSIDEVVFESTGGSNAPEFQLDPAGLPAAPFELAPGDTQAVSVIYAPMDPAPDTDRVRVRSTGLAAPAFVELTGEAGPMPVPRIEVTPRALDFGQVEIGHDKPLNLRITSVGTANLVLTGSVTVRPANAPIRFQNAPAANQVFAPADSREMQVILRPTAVGRVPTATVVIASNDPTEPVIQVPIRGEGVDLSVPILFVDPNPLDFGRVPRGTNASRALIVRNDGTAPLTLSSVRLANDAGGRFRLPAPPMANLTLSPMQQQSFNVDFLDNGMVATHMGALEIRSNDPMRPTFTVTLRAETAPPPPQITDIALTLTWSRMPADVDLHLLKPGRTYFQRPGDCCFCNTNPDWGVVGQPQDDPFLDRDDLVGPGPENINLSQAETGDYTVVIHFFDHKGGGPADATVNVQLRGRSVAMVTRTLNDNDKWTVGTVHWNAATGTGTWSPQLLFPVVPSLSRLCF